MSIKIDNINYSYGKKINVDNISFSLGDGEILGIIGPNGAGKTTLLKCILDIFESTGSTFVDNIDYKSLNLNERSKLIAYVPQYLSIIYKISVYEFITLGIDIKNKQNSANIDSIIKCFFLENLVFKDMTALSGGERQRVMIARAMAQNPRVIVLDEPTNNLDLKHQKNTMEILREFSKNKNISVIMTIHDLNIASSYCDTLLILKNGSEYAKGNTESIITKDNIEEVYEVEVQILNHNNKKIIVLK